MTVTVDLVVENLRTGTTSPQTYTHGGAASGVKGVVLCLIHGTSSTDHVSAASYGGVAMTRKKRNVDTATEAGAAEIWFLGTGVPQGSQTVSYTPGSTTDDILAVSITLLGANTNMGVQDTDGIDNNVANPSVTLNYGGRSSMSFGALYSGLSLIGDVTAGASCTKINTLDLAGNFTAAVVRQTTAGTSDFAIACTAVTDDVAYAAISVTDTILTVATARADEVDSAFALTGKKIRALGRADEVDSASALTGKKIGALGRADELDTASALTARKLVATGQADEVDSAFALDLEQGGAIELPVGQADEADSAFALGGVKQRATGRADEVDTASALAGVKARQVTRSDEIDTASALSGAKLRAVSRSDEVDTASALAGVKRGTVARADEIDTALGGRRLIAVSRADEIDTAFALELFVPGVVGQAEETDTAFALSAVKMRVLERADELDFAFALAVEIVRTVGMAVEADTAFALDLFVEEAVVPPLQGIRRLRSLLDAGVPVDISTFQKGETWAKRAVDVDVIHITIGADRWELSYREFRRELNETQRNAIRIAPSSPLRAQS